RHFLQEKGGCLVLHFLLQGKGTEGPLLLQEIEAPHIEKEIVTLSVIILTDINNNTPLAIVMKMTLIEENQDTVIIIPNLLTVVEEGTEVLPPKIGDTKGE